MEGAEARRADVQRYADGFSSWFLPVVSAIALVTWIAGRNPLAAAAVLVGSAIMLADPIFQGLAMSLMAGEVAATLLSRLAVPVLYELVARHGRAAELQRAGAEARATAEARARTVLTPQFTRSAQ